MSKISAFVLSADERATNEAIKNLKAQSIPKS